MSDQSASSGIDPYLLYGLSDSNELHNFMELSASDSDDDWGATSPAVTRLATAPSPSPEVGSEKYEAKLKEYRLLDDFLKENGTAPIFEEHFLARQASKAAKRGAAQIEAQVASGNRALRDGERQPKPAGRLKHKYQWVRTAPDTGTATARPPKRPCVRDQEPGPSASPPSRGNHGHLDWAGDEWRGVQPRSFGAQSPNQAPGVQYPLSIMILGIPEEVDEDLNRLTIGKKVADFFRREFQVPRDKFTKLCREPYFRDTGQVHADSTLNLELRPRPTVLTCRTVGDRNYLLRMAPLIEARSRGWRVTEASP